MKNKNFAVTLTSFLPSFTSIIFLTFFVGIIFFFNEIKDFDFWWHLATGKFISQFHKVPHTDIFSFIAFGKKWISHEWLSGLLFYKIYTFFNLKGILIFKALLISSTLAFLFHFLVETKKINVFLSLFLILLCTASYMSMWTERPYHFTLLFSLLFLIILEKNNPTYYILPTTYLLPLLMLFWANLHGGFFIGFIILTIYIFDALLEKNFQNAKIFSFVALLCFITSLINPHGFLSFYFPFSYMGKEVIKEWAVSNWLNEPELLIYFLLIFISFFMSRKEKENRFLLITIIFGFLALTARRNVPLFSLLITPFLGVHLQMIFDGSQAEAKRKPSRSPSGHGVSTDVASVETSEDERRAASASLGRMTACFRWLLPRTILIFIFIFFIIFYLKNNHFNPLLNPKRYPIKTVEFLKKNNLESEIFNPYNWGGFLIWHLYPKYKVFVDSRADLYGQEIITDAVNIERGISNWREILEKYDVKYVLVPKDSGLGKILNKQNQKNIIYEDETAIIWKLAFGLTLNKKLRAL
jgi:hypothetical protein